MKHSWMALVASTALLAGSAAQAQPLLDFVIKPVHPGTASVSYGGAGGALVGQDIAVASVTGLGTPANDLAQLTITGGTLAGGGAFASAGILNFTTGNLVSTGPNTWVFGGGGSISITGGSPPWASRAARPC
jgi:hypothetical protein